jgi:translation initiation factor 2 beta subunit (eIF-2beta)/eIF-5
MATLVKCPHCGSYNTQKTVNGKLSDTLAKTGSILGGALINMAT